MITKQIKTLQPKSPPATYPTFIPVKSIRSVSFRSESFHSESGLHILTFTVFSVIIGAALYAAYQIFPFYYYYWELENQFQSVIRVASMEKDIEIRRRLMEHIKRMKIPCEPEDLVIERDGKVMKISLPYDEVLTVSWKDKQYDLHRFEFLVYAEGEM